MRRKSDSHGVSSSPRGSAYSVDDESFALNFEDKQFFSALYEFSQGLGPVQIWTFSNSNESLMRFIVNTPPPDLASNSTYNYGERITNVISKFEDFHYIAIYSQVLDCQARGFARSIVLVVANQSPEIIKYVNEAYIDELTKIIDHIYKNSYELFLNEIQGYTISLLKTTEATKSHQLKSKFEELKIYLSNFGINVENIINDHQQHQNADQISSKNKNGEIKDESFFTTIDNNLRSIREITDFNYSIIDDLQNLVSNLPITETSAAISAHINFNYFREFTSYKLYKTGRKLSDQLSLKNFSDDTIEKVSFTMPEKSFTSSSVDSLIDKSKPPLTENEKSSIEILDDDRSSNFSSTVELSEITESENPDSRKPPQKMTPTPSPPPPPQIKKKQSIRETNKKRTESIWKHKQQQKKKQAQIIKQQNRRYNINYNFDFNFGGFKGRYAELVTNILNTNYDCSLFTLQWLVKSKVFHYCAFTILSGGTLVIVTNEMETIHGKQLADRFSLLAPYSLIKSHKKNKKMEKESEELKYGDLTVRMVKNGEFENEIGINSTNDDDDDDSEIILVKDSVEPRECFKYSIVVTNNIKPSCLPKQPTLETEIARCSEKVGKYPIVTTYSRANEKDDSLLSVLDLTTNVYKGDGCPSKSFVMDELGKETSLRLIGQSNNNNNSNSTNNNVNSSNTNSGNGSGGSSQTNSISPNSSTTQVGYIQHQQSMMQFQQNLQLKSNQVGISSSTSVFSPVSSRRRSKPSNKQTVNSPPSPLSMASDSSVRFDGSDQLSPTQSFSQGQPFQPKNVSIRNVSSSIITMSGSNSNSNLAGGCDQNEKSDMAVNGYDNELTNQSSMLAIEAENDSDVSTMEIESENDSMFSSINQSRRGPSTLGVGTYSCLKHGKRLSRPSFWSSEMSTISSSTSMAAVESSESENLFVLNMHAAINRKAASFVLKLAEISEKKKIPPHDELMKEIGFDEGDEPILKYWIYCFFNKQKCRPVLFNNKSNVGFTVISMYK